MTAVAIPATLIDVAEDARTERLDLRALYQQHAAFLRSAIQRLGGPRVDADDLLHEVFIVALDRADSFEGRSTARTWLYGIALKIVAAHRRKSKLRAFFGMDDVPPDREPVDAQTPATVLDTAQAKKTVFDALEKIAEKKRTVFVLYELEGLSGEEIAQIVGCPLKTVWTRLFHARAEFQKHLKLCEAQEAAGLLVLKRPAKDEKPVDVDARRAKP